LQLLLKAHRVLIGSAILLGAFLVGWGIWQWRRTGDRSALALAVGSGLVALALTIYLLRVVTRYARRR
jgi:hypothetical protein